MSGIDTDSDSDGNDNAVDNQLQVIDNEEPVETPYIPAPEEELNTVNIKETQIQKILLKDSPSLLDNFNETFPI